MKYTMTNTINKPQDEVVAKFTEPHAGLKWMEGLKKIEYTSGEPYQKGTKAQVYTEYKGREMVMTEEILESDLPGRIMFGYTSKMGYNTVDLRFEKIDENSVRQVSHNDFQMKGVMKLMGFMFKGMMKKQTLKYMDAFKDYAEKGA